MELYLIRHGQCYDSTPDHFSNEKGTMNPPLTPQGIRQAQLLADRLKTNAFDKIYCSDLDRALQTAEILQSSVHCDLVVTKAFREIHMGDIHIKSWDAFPELLARFLKHEEDLPYPNGECGADVWSRCKQELNTILTQPYERIAIVCHGGTIRSIVGGILGIPPQRRFLLGCPPHNCSISILHYTDQQYSLHTFNDYAHLEAPPK